MKKILNNYIVIFLVFLLFVSCVKDKNVIDQTNILKIGVTSTPHGEILQNIKNMFKLDFEIINYIDYELLNKDLVEGKIDGNFFQTREYLNRFNLNIEDKLIELVEVHIEPLIIYSDKYKSVNKVSDGDVVYIPNDPVNRDRSLKLLDKAGLLKIDMDFNGQGYIISENFKNLIINEVDANSLPYFYKEGDLVVMNTNIALENNIFPHLSGIFYEEAFLDKDKVNVFVTRKDMSTSDVLKKIAYFLNNYETIKFINENYRGFVRVIY